LAHPYGCDAWAARVIKISKELVCSNG
jgi:hypothetical protein